MRVSILKYISCSLIIVVFLVGCRKKEVVVEIEDFIGYQKWQVVDYNIVPNPILGETHMGMNEEYSRRVYINPSGKMSREKYTNGTILVMEVFTWEDGKKKFADKSEILAMVKRGGNFNPKAGGWEWFFLSPKLEEEGLSRGGELIMNGICNSCHNKAKDTEGIDFVFLHPKEYTVDDAIFANYKDWSLIGETAEPHPKLMEAHKGGLRRVFKKQPLANPDTDWGYPIGTIIVKDVKKDSEITSITAMVKRGAEFNKEHGGWEWFVINPKDYTVKDRGADLMDGMCNMCHEAANEPEFGMDHVFKHPNDPFNK